MKIFKRIHGSYLFWGLSKFHILSRSYRLGEQSKLGKKVTYINPTDIEENKSTSEKALKVKRSADQDIESELTKIKELFEKGLITQEVYEAKQKEILGLN